MWFLRGSWLPTTSTIGRSPISSSPFAASIDSGSARLPSVASGTARISGPDLPTPPSMLRHPRYSTAALSEIVAIRSNSAIPTSPRANPADIPSAVVSAEVKGTVSNPTTEVAHRLCRTNAW